MPYFTRCHCVIRSSQGRAVPRPSWVWSLEPLLQCPKPFQAFNCNLLSSSQAFPLLQTNFAQLLRCSLACPGHWSRLSTRLASALQPPHPSLAGLCSELCLTVPRLPPGPPKTSAGAPEALLTAVPRLPPRLPPGSQKPCTLP